MNVVDHSHHICLICSKTIVGLLQYVEHFKSHATPDVVKINPQQDQKPFKEEQSAHTHSVEVYDDDAAEMVKPNTSELPSESLSHNNSSHVYYDETSSLSAFANQEFPEPEMEADALLSPKYNIDFFQSLELKSINEETAPSTKSKLKATQRLSILEDDIHAENLLPITSILSNLDFSSDEDDEIAGTTGPSSNNDKNWSDEDETGSGSRAHPPRHHTGGKWKPGQGPDKKKISSSMSSSSSSFSKKLPIAGKWKPNSSPGPASHKAIMKGNKKKVRGPMAYKGTEFECDICGDCFPDRTSYSQHLGAQKHKDAMAERRQSKKTIENPSQFPQEIGLVVAEVDEAVIDNTVAVTNVAPRINSIRPLNVDKGAKSQDKDEDQYHCPVCDLYFRSSFVFQTHCETKVHKDGLLKQGFREYRSNDGAIIRVDVRTDTIYTDRQENQLLAAKQPKNLGQSDQAEEEKHECTICRKVFKRKYEMARHLLTRMHRVRAQYKPMDVWVDMLDKYNKYMTRLSLFQCAICQFYFNRQHDFLDHMCSPRHVKSCKDMLGPIMCVACKYKTHKHGEMMQHIQTIEHYQTVEKYHGLCIVRESHTSITCKFCGIQMHSAARIKRHCQLRHANRLGDVQEAIDVKLSSNARHKCPICGKLFKVKTLLQFHFLRSHKQNPFFTCTICNRGFMDQRRLDNHLRTRFHAKRVIAAKLLDEEEKKNQENQHSKNAQKDDADKKKDTTGEHESEQIVKDILEKCVVAVADKKETESINLDNVERNSDKFPKTNRRVVTKSKNITKQAAKSDKVPSENVRRSSRKRKKIKFSDEDSDEESKVDESEKPQDQALVSVRTAQQLRQKLTNKELIEEADENVSHTLTAKEKGVLDNMSYVKNIKKSPRKSKKKKSEDIDDIDKEVLEEASKSVFTCTYCDFSALDLLELRSHYNESHPCDILTCQPCNQFFLSLKAYKIHCTGRGHQLKMREESGETEMHACPLCEKRFLQASICALHVETVHRHPNSEEDLQRIHKGSDLVTQLYGDHVAQVEKLSNDTSISCPECGRFVRKDTLIEHLRLHTGERPYSCRFCNKSFAGRLSLRRHISSHLDMPLFFCDLCGKEFKRKTHLFKHMQQHDNEKRGVKYPCTVCKATFFTEEELERHKKRHGERNYPCTWPGCQWTFVNHSELKCHTLTHTQERVFLCDQCGYGAVSKHRLRRHVRTHQNLRPHACDYCPYKASLKTHLVRHMRIHINSKPFACPYCKFTCNTHENIRKHILKTQKHKGKKLYPCKLCSDFGCNSSSEFKGHLMSVHADYLREHAVDSLAVFSGLYKKEEDFTKPKEGSEIRQVNKGRFYKQYTNPGGSPSEIKPVKSKEEKTEKKTITNSKQKVVAGPQEVSDTQGLESTQQEKGVIDIDTSALKCSVLEAHPDPQSLVITSPQSNHIVTLEQGDLPSSSSKVVQFQLDSTGNALEMTVEQPGGNTTTSTIDLPHYIEIPNVVIQESLAAAADVVNNATNNTDTDQQIFPVTFAVPEHLDEQLQQQQHLQQQQPHEDLQLQQHFQQLQQQQSSIPETNRVYWVEAATPDNNQNHSLNTSIDDSANTSIAVITQQPSSISHTTQQNSWYTGITQVHAAETSCHDTDITHLASNLHAVDNNQVSAISVPGGQDDTPTFLPDKYFRVTAAQIFNNTASGDGTGKIVVLRQPDSSDMQ